MESAAAEELIISKDKLDQRIRLPHYFSLVSTVETNGIKIDQIKSNNPTDTSAN